jgi:peptide methionine sulfoxide reductase msrA/msrB
MTAKPGRDAVRSAIMRSVPAGTSPLVFALSFGALVACTPARTTDASLPHVSATVARAAGGPTGDGAAPPENVTLGGPRGSQPYARPTEADLKARLTPLQFEVTQNAATEPPFQNAYWNNHSDGIYVDVATGEPLFSSRDKFESGTGWPSFVRPIEDGRVIEHTDDTLGMVRTEVVSKGGRSHLGHVFDDGPAPTGRRYCINSASLRFIPAARLLAEGYGAYAQPFGVALAAASPPPATSNSCTLPPPGEAPGCSATLDVALFARTEGDAQIARPAGVLEVVEGDEGGRPAVEVTFDPSKLSYADLVGAWTAGRESRSLVYARSDGQRKVATARAIRVIDAVPFARAQE